MDWYINPWIQVLIGIIFITIGLVLNNRSNRPLIRSGWNLFYVIWGAFHLLIAILIAGI